MPITRSAKKALRNASRKTSINRHRKALFKNAIRSMTAEPVKAQSMIDKAAKWQIIHPNKAARLKQRLTKTVIDQPAKIVAKKSAAKKSSPKPKK